MGVDDSLGFTRQVLDWYWKIGHRRTGKYALPKGTWLDQLASAGTQLEVLQAAGRSARPSVAIWGPSQTGKSTLASKYIDAKVRFVGDGATDGHQSGLHWEGGAPCFFLKPEEKPAEGLILREGTLVLNPYNSGLDASACLSRFVLGSTRRGDGLHFVQDPKFPVDLQWVKPRELWQSIARGYDSQCFGPPVANAPVDDTGRPPPRFPRTWTREKFIDTLRKHRDVRVPDSAQPLREAHELLQEFCDLIEDLIFAELPRFRQLQSSECNWKALRHAILTETGEGAGQQNALHYDVARAYAFTAEILWDGYSVLSDLHRAMRAMLHTMRERWGNKPVRCSLEVAALFLDMETYLVYLKPLPERARPKDIRIHATVPALGWQDRGDHIVIGADKSLPNRLIERPEQFAMLQGLVWEMVVPLNPEHLEDTPFKGFLQRADLLDFPGVERGGTSGDKIDLERLGRIRAGDRPNDGITGERDEPYQFFLRVLKRGKTSSIVSTYAQRLSIDAFCIFQDLDRDKPNAGQLVEGINSWWKNSAPDYFRNPRGRSPLPLNFVLLWWANFFNEGQDFTNLAKKLSGLGPIADPEVSTTFALNYYSLPRGAVRPELEPRIPDMVGTLQAEAAFKHQFQGTQSQASFAAMIADKRSGGTDFFFAALTEQVAPSAEASSPRMELLRRKSAHVIAQISELMQQHDLYPNPVPVDERRGHLLRFRESLEALTATANEKELRKINHALRCFLDVDFNRLVSIPRSLIDINADHIRGQLQEWINSKPAAADAGGPTPAVIGLGERDRLLQTLNALAESLEPDLESVAAWLRRLVQYAQAAGGEEVDLRRHLALHLGNLIVFGSAGPRVRVQEEYDDPGATAPDAQASPVEPRGRACRYYRDFIEPFAGPGGHLASLAERQVVPVTRPDQPGDPELVTLSRPTHAHLIPGHRDN